MDSPIRLDDNISAPTATVYVTSAGFQAEKGANKLIANAGGIQLQSNIGGYVNTLTMDTGSLQLFSSNNSVVINSAGVTLTKGGVGGAQMTVDATSIRAINGSSRVTVSAASIVLDNSGNTHNVSLTSDRVRVYGDASHYVEVTSAGDINLVGGKLSINVGGQISTSNATFDATYNSLCLKNELAPDAATFISRGMVIYYQSVKIGAMVRGANPPTANWMEIEFPTGAGRSYALLSGQAGVGMRSDAGYSVGGVRCIDSNGKFIAEVTGTCSGPITGTISGSVSTAGTVYAGGGHSGGPFTGSSVSTGGVVNGASFQVGGIEVINSSRQFVGAVYTTGNVNCAAFGATGGGSFGSSLTAYSLSVNTSVNCTEVQISTQVVINSSRGATFTNCSSSGGYTGGAFSGAGVNVGANGIGGGSLTINGSGSFTGTMNAATIQRGGRDINAGVLTTSWTVQSISPVWIGWIGLQDNNGNFLGKILYC